jgi:short-subunit dehydrogenase
VPSTGSESTTKRALITGASSGVGAAFAQLLSREGYQAVLVGRNKERLESVAAGLAHPAQVVVADLTEEAELASVEALVADAAPVDLLVNNAGAGWYRPFARLDPEHLAEMIALNVTALLRLTRAAVPIMVARGQGSLINISSVAGAYPAPNMAVYAATKAFVSNLSTSLAEELRGSGVTVTCVNPGYVRTDFHARSGENLDHIDEADWISPTDVAARALAAHRRGEELVTVYPEAPLWRRIQRSGRASLVRRAPWLRDVKHALTASGRAG